MNCEAQKWNLEDYNGIYLISCFTHKTNNRVIQFIYWYKHNKTWQLLEKKKSTKGFE